MQVVLVYFQPFCRNLLWKCALQPKNAKKLPKSPLLGVRSRSRSSMLIGLKLKSPWPVLVMTNSMSVPICNRFYTRRANSGKITFFSRGTFLTLSFEKTLTQKHKILSRKTSVLWQPTVKIWSSYFLSFWHNTAVCRTNRQTEERTPRKWLKRA